MEFVPNRISGAHCHRARRAPIVMQAGVCEEIEQLVEVPEVHHTEELEVKEEWSSCFTTIFLYFATLYFAREQFQNTPPAKCIFWKFYISRGKNLEISRQRNYLCISGAK